MNFNPDYITFSNILFLSTYVNLDAKRGGLCLPSFAAIASRLRTGLAARTSSYWRAPVSIHFDPSHTARRTPVQNYPHTTAPEGDASVG